MTKVFWTPQYSVHVKLMDDQHKGIIALMNETYDRAEHIISPREVEDFFSRLQSYFSGHFSLEEKYFDLFKYDKAEEHKKEHRRIAQKIENLKKRYRLNGTNTTLFEMIELMEDYLLNHITSFDKKYTKCFNEHGFS